MFITEYSAYLLWKAIYATKDDNVVAVGKHTYKKDKYNLEKMLVVCFSQVSFWKSIWIVNLYLWTS